MTRRRIAIVASLLLLLAAGIGWWKFMRGGGGKAPPAAAAEDTWGDPGAVDRALAARKRAARGDTPVDSAPASLSGHVRRAADGSGVAGAVVSVAARQFAGAIFGDPGGSPTVVAVTDATGAWTADNVAPGRRVVTATALDLLPASLEVDVAPRANRTGVDLSLAAGGATVSGLISDIGGGPIADARVTVRPAGVRMLDSSAELIAVSGDDGRYRMTLPPDSWQANVSHDDYAGEERSFVLRDRPVTVDFTMTPGGMINGTVIARDTGKPLPGARVTATGGHGGRDDEIGGIGGVVTDDAGHFTMKGLGSGALSLWASARGYTSPDATVVEVGIGEQVDGVTVMVDRAYTISGFVVRRGTEGEGIPGVRVGVFSITKGWNVFAQLPSADDGYFEIFGVRPATYMLVALGDNVMLEVGKSITVDKADLTDVIIAMDDGASLSGKVEPAAVTQLGLSINSEKVGFGNMFDVARAAMVTGTSDAQGNFTLRNTPKGTYTIVAQAADGRNGKLPVTIGTDDQTGLVVKLEDRGAISGRVFDVNRSPVAGVHVNASSHAGDLDILSMEGGASQTVTAADGSYRVGGLAPGEVDLVVSDENGRLKWADADGAKKATRTITGTEELKGVDLVVEARDGVIRGVVLGLDRVPMPDVWVTARAHETWDPRAEARAQAQSRNNDDGSRGGVEVRVEVHNDNPDGGTGTATPTPTPPADDDLPDWGPGKTVLTGADGRFVIKDLRRGEYSVVAEATKGGVRAQKTHVKTGDTVTLVLEKLGVLSGVVTSGGAPVTAYDLDCDGPGDNQRRHVAAADGRYRIERLPPGKYTCHAEADAGSGNAETRLVGEAGTLDITLAGWGSITGVVVDGSGNPRPGLVVIATGEGGDPGSAFAAMLTGEGPATDASGRFQVGRLGPGTGQLMLFDRAEGMQPIHTQEFTLTPGQRLDLGTITPKPPGAPDGGS